jgi:hypothetical protein
VAARRRGGLLLVPGCRHSVGGGGSDGRGRTAAARRARPQHGVARRSGALTPPLVERLSRASTTAADGAPCVELTGRSRAAAGASWVGAVGSHGFLLTLDAQLTAAARAALGPAMATNGLPQQFSASSQMSIGSSASDGSESPKLAAAHLGAGHMGGANGAGNGINGVGGGLGPAPGPGLLSPSPRIADGRAGHLNGGGAGQAGSSAVARQLEETVMFLVDPTKTADKAACARAMAFEKQVRESSDGLQLALQMLTESTNPNVKFWCLQTVLDAVEAGRFKALEQSQRDAVKQSLMVWMTEASAAAEVFIKNKFAKVLIQLYLTGLWPSFFHDLVSAVPLGHHVADLFIRTLKCVDEEIACREAQENFELRARNTVIKDSMREDCMPQLIDACFTIVESTSGTPEHMPLARSCLEIIPAYTTWVGLDLIACDRFLSKLLQFLSEEELRVAAADNLHAIVCKQMAPEDKLPLLQRLQLLPLLQAGASLVQEGAAVDHEAFVAKLAALTSAFASECMDCSDQLYGRAGMPEEADRFLLGCVPLVYVYMNALDHGPSSACCVTFLQEYLNRLRKVCGRKQAAASVTAPHVELLAPLVDMLYSKMLYPADFKFGNPAEDENDFLERRKELAVLFRTAASINEVVALQRTLSAVRELAPADGKQVPFQLVEGALTLLLQLTEAEKAAKGAKSLEKVEVLGAANARDAAVASLLAVGPDLNVQYAPQRCVVGAYLRLARGSAAVMKAQSESLVNPVLTVFFEAMLSTDRNVEPYETTRAIDAQQIFVKWLQKEGGADLTAKLCFEQAFQAVLSLFQAQPTKELAEAVGLMISTDAAHVVHLEQVLIPVLQQLEQAIASATGDGCVIDGVGLCLSICSFVCKGFCRKSTGGLLKSEKGIEVAERVNRLLQSCLELCVKAVAATPTDTAARSALVTLIRSVLIITDFTALLPWVIAAVEKIVVSVGRTAEADGVVEMLELFGGFATRYKAEIAPLIQLPGLVEAVTDLSLQVAGPLSEVGGRPGTPPSPRAVDAAAAAATAGQIEELSDKQRDSRRVRNALAYLIFWVTNAGLTDPFVTEPMRQRLPALCHAVALAVSTPPFEHPACKNGFSSLATLVKLWCKADAAGAEPFVCRTLPRLCVQALLLPELNLSRKPGAGVIAVVAGLHRSAASHYKAAFDPVLLSLLGALGVPSHSETAAQAMAAVHGADMQPYSALLLQIVQHSKSR